jgi:hypothetical protein
MNASVVVRGLLRSYFPTTPILYAVGNHEPYPVDQDEGPGLNAWWTSGLGALWLDWAPQSVLDT